MANFRLEIPNATAIYDPETHITRIEYRGILDGDVTIQVYDWLDDLYRDIGLDAIMGQIFDFRKVQAFEESNLSTARRTSNRMNMRVDTSNIPVALLVNDFYHEEILRGSMRIPAEHVRKRIVWSEDEALNYIKNWHNNKENQTP
ncbi:MAG: hypothetical protein MUE54_04980 [Anaerolineae bacterium]|jgi:hypothetical protein|nr:hypothetical protein [Anaerolineae bacterium]